MREYPDPASAAQIRWSSKFDFWAFFSSLNVPQQQLGKAYQHAMHRAMESVCVALARDVVEMQRSFLMLSGDDQQDAKSNIEIRHMVFRDLEQKLIEAGFVFKR